MLPDDTKLPDHIEKLLANNKYLQALRACQAEKLDTSRVTKLAQECATNALSFFNKREYEQSIHLYIETIGFVDPSIVLWHFNVPHLSIHLTNYLIELHKEGFANKSHTGLLFLLFRNHDAKNKLEEFINLLREAKQNSQNDDDNLLIRNFDAGAAIESLLENEMEKEALEIAWIIDSPQHIVYLLITYQKDYVAAAKHLQKSSNSDIGRKMLMDFGPTLLKNDEKTHEIIIQVAKDIWTSSRKGKDEDYLKLFQSQPECCFKFLKSIVGYPLPSVFGTTLIAIVIPKKGEIKSEFFGLPKIATEQLAVEYIKNERIKYDPDFLLRICAESKFTKGMILILELQGRLHDITTLLIANRESQYLKEWCLHCQKIPDEDWVEIFEYFSQPEGWNALIQNQEGLDFMRKVIENASRTMPLASLVKNLSNIQTPLSLVRDELIAEYTKIQKEIEKQKAYNKDLRQELNDIDQEILKLEEKDIQFDMHDGCSICKQRLDKNFIAFMCNHIVHDKCAKEHNGEYYCPICGYCDSPEYPQQPENAKSFTIDTSKHDLLDQAIDLIKSGFLDQKL